MSSTNVKRLSAPSAHQVAIFDHLLNTTTNLLVQAVAGSGKTTTIIEAMRRMQEACPDLVCYYAVFNKANQVEAQERLAGTTVVATTMHSLGFRSMSRMRLRIGKDLYKTSKGLEAGLSKQEMKSLLPFARRMVGLARAVGIGVEGMLENTLPSWIALAGEHGIEVGEGCSLAQGCSLAMKLLALSMQEAEHKSIDFDDMLYLSVHQDFGGRFPKCDVLFVDEAQDMSPVQIEMIARIAAKGTRIVAVGDRGQAIYGWRGAQSDSMDEISRRFNCSELPLSVSWRCARSIVEVAASYGMTIESAPTAPEGEVVKSKPGHVLPDGATVLSRTVAPLVAACYSLIKARRPARVLGREIGQGLVSLIKGLKGSNVNDMLGRLTAWQDREVLKCGEREDKIAAVEDRCECVRVMCEGLPPDAYTIDRLCEEIEDMFQDKGATAKTVTFSSIHKAKGMEWDQVHILDAHKLPSAWAKREWQRVQEVNCAYVAVTRAKSSLVLLRGEHLAA